MAGRAASARASRKRAYHHGNLREALIEESVELIREEGVRALTLREIGRRLHVSRTAPYRHFIDKAALLSAISKAGFTKFAEVLEQARNSAGPDFANRLDAMARAYVRFAAENPGSFEVMFGAGSEPQYLDETASVEAKRAFEVLHSEIRQGQDTGMVGPGDSLAYARLVWAMVHGLATLRMFDDTAFTDFCSRALRRGLSPAL
ncbi:MAG: TetR/AcrR family transcriptional regulator [Acidobacteriaceae bacterium]|nr:TetR/AcrR family transcriptional regulator [Acidobacteriaceae bacterium]